MRFAQLKQKTFDTATSMADCYLSLLHFHVLALVNAIDCVTLHSRSFGLRNGLFLIARLCLGIVISVLLPQVCSLACSTSCLEPLVQPVLIQVLLQNLIIEQIILDDGSTDLLVREAHAELSVGASSTDQGCELLGPYNTVVGVVVYDASVQCSRLGYRLTYQSGSLGP